MMIKVFIATFICFWSRFWECLSGILLSARAFREAAAG